MTVLCCGDFFLGSRELLQAWKWGVLWQDLGQDDEDWDSSSKLVKCPPSKTWDFVTDVYFQPTDSAVTVSPIWCHSAGFPTRPGLVQSKNVKVYVSILIQHCNVIMRCWADSFSQGFSMSFMECEPARVELLHMCLPGIRTHLKGFMFRWSAGRLVACFGRCVVVCGSPLFGMQVTFVNWAWRIWWQQGVCAGGSQNPHSAVSAPCSLLLTVPGCRQPNLDTMLHLACLINNVCNRNNGKIQTCTALMMHQTLSRLAHVLTQLTVKGCSCVETTTEMGSSYHQTDEHRLKTVLERGRQNTVVLRYIAPK